MDIIKLEAMAKLKLPDSEREKISIALNSLTAELDAFANTQTPNAEPLPSVLELSNILREDKNEKLITRDELLQNAPEQYDGYFQVPGTLE